MMKSGLLAFGCLAPGGFVEDIIRHLNTFNVFHIICISKFIEVLLSEHILQNIK